MALKKKPIAKTVKPTENEKYFTISVEKKKKILGIFLMVISFLVFLSLITYSAFDKAQLNYRWDDVLKVFSSDNSVTLSTRNWLGISGAYVSDFFIKPSFFANATMHRLPFPQKELSFPSEL